MGSAYMHQLLLWSVLYRAVTYRLYLEAAVSDAVILVYVEHEAAKAAEIMMTFTNTDMK